MKKSIAFYFLLHLSVLTNAQNTANCNINELLSEAQANYIAQKIFRTLGGKGTCPQVFYDTSGAIATYTNGDKIRISTLAIEKLKQFGCDADDCLAIIIGHELRHALQGEVGEHYGSSSSETEMDADLFGLLAAHLTGYTTGIKRYDQMLSVLGLKGSTTYTVEQRKQNNDIIKKRLNEIIPLYQAGVYNLLMGDADELDRAAACFEMANKNLEQKNDKFEFPQFNYQLGVVYFLKALKEYNGENKWVFPLEILDADFLENRRGGNDYGKPEEMKRMLDSADGYFNKMKTINPNDWEARLALANVATLRIAAPGGSVEYANKLINKLLTDLSEETEAYKSKTILWEIKYYQSLRELADKAALLKILVKLVAQPNTPDAKTSLSTLVQNSDFQLVRRLSSANLRLLNKEASSSQPQTSLELPERDGLNAGNWKEIVWPYITGEKINFDSKSMVGDDPLLVFTPEGFNDSHIMTLGTGVLTYAFQEYKTCPLSASTVNNAGGAGKTGTGDFRYFENKDKNYRVIVEMSNDGKVVEKCTKVFH